MQKSLQCLHLQSGIWRKCYYVAYCLRDFDRKRCRAFQIFIFNVRISLTSEGDQGIYTFTFWAYFAVSAADLLHWCWCGDHVNIDGRWCLLCNDTASHHWLSSPHHPLLELDTAVGALNKQAELLFPRILNTKQILWSDNEDWDWEHSLHRFYLNLLLHLLLLLHFTTRLAAVL